MIKSFRKDQSDELNVQTLLLIKGIYQVRTFGLLMKKDKVVPNRVKSAIGIIVRH